METEDRKHYLRRWAALENERSSWFSHWQEISDYIAPRRGRFLTSDANRGRKRNTKIIDSTGILALRTLASGMMSGLTSPARPWFRIATPDPGLMEFGPVKDWLSIVEKQLYAIFAASNFYNAIYTVYTELGAFGTAPLYREDDFENVVRFRPFTAGEYAIAEGEDGKVDTLYREFEMTSGQMVKRFDIEAVSTGVKQAFNLGNYDQRFNVIHAIEPRRSRNSQKRDGKNMPVASCYLEEAGDKFLNQAGYKKFPAYVPRWDVLGGEDYGRSPAMDALGDVKQLQQEQRRKSEALDKVVSPPMKGPSSLKNQPADVRPAGMTYVSPQDAVAYGPAYEIRPDLGAITADIREVQARINSIFFADLFMMLANLDGVQPRNVMELAERKEEKLLQLGPVLQRLNTDLFDPLIDDVFDRAAETGILPPAPRELIGPDGQGSELKIEYISILAQAQQAVGAVAIERTLSFAGNLIGVYPEVRHKIDALQAVDEYAAITGAPSRIIRSDDDTGKLIEEERAAMEAQQMAAGVNGAAQTAKLMSETDVASPNALTALVGA